MGCGSTGAPQERPFPEAMHDAVRWMLTPAPRDRPRMADVVARLEGMLRRPPWEAGPAAGAVGAGGGGGLTPAAPAVLPPAAAVAPGWQAGDGGWTAFAEDAAPPPLSAADARRGEGVPLLPAQQQLVT